MLPLPDFTYHAPTTLAEVVSLLAAHRGEARVLAGGTDLLPNMKHGIQEPRHLVALRNVEGLKGITPLEGALRIGALTTLTELAEDARVRVQAPSLADAASQVAGPQLRAMGTLGGNLCLDTRCVYYNQTYFWRKSLGFCLKKDGTACHVVAGGKRCVAAASNDSAPVLLTLGATVRTLSGAGPREIPIEKFYVADGIKNTCLGDDEVVVAVDVPTLVRSSTVRDVAGFSKLRVRAAIDFPQLNIGVWARIEAERVTALKVAVSALGARPVMVKKLEPAIGKPLDAALIAEVGRIAQAQSHPLTSLNVDPEWRRDVIPAFVRKAFARALSTDQ